MHPTLPHNSLCGGPSNTIHMPRATTI